MIIGIIDSNHFALQDRLLREGHELHVFVDGVPFPSLMTPATEVQGENFVPYAGIVDFIRAIPELDLVLSDGQDTLEYATVYSAARVNGVPVIGYDPTVVALESYRGLAFEVLGEYAETSDLVRLPEAREFESKEELTLFLENTKRDWVIKKGVLSPAIDFETRTVILRNSQIKSILPLITETLPNSWFNEKGEGGARLEEFASGMEWSFAVFYDGEKISPIAYVYKEYKGPQNADRSLIQTGEVGTLFKWFPLEEGSEVWNMFTSILTHPLLNGKFSGILDINMIVAPDLSSATLIEFTTRWGRPSLEVMLGGMKSVDDYTFSEFLQSLGSGELSEDWCHPMYSGLNIGKFNVGVTVFDYGSPFSLCNSDKKPILKAERPFTMPKNENRDGSRVVPYWCFYDNSQETWKTSMSGMQPAHFVAVGSSENGGIARVNAYSLLLDFNEFGMTWRDDIGNNQDLHDLGRVADKFLKKG